MRKGHSFHSGAFSYRAQREFSVIGDHQEILEITKDEDLARMIDDRVSLTR